MLQAWQEWGAACVDRFNGMFAFAIWDRRDRSVSLVRDRYGIKSPARICPEPSEAEQADCQIVESPVAPGHRLVDEGFLDPSRQRGRAIGLDDEIRLTYRELTALIEDAVKQLR